MNPQTKTSLQKFLKSREAIQFKAEDYCFDKQLEFINDPAPFKTACCSRRAGKTIADAAYLIKAALAKPNVVCLYITLTRSNAKKLIWPELLKINQEFKLGGNVHEAEISLSFKNKSIIYCSGAKDEKEIEKFRGLPIYLCIIDECQSFRAYIQRLIDEVISKALFDYAGTLALTGTPGPVPVGYFYDTCQSKEYQHFAWTFFDNPWIEKKAGKTPQELLERELKRKGVTVDDPTIQRECFGRWAHDPNVLVYRYNAGINHYDVLPTHATSYKYVLGVDLGFDDADAIAIIGWNDRDKRAYLIEETITRKQGISELAAQIQLLINKYSPHKIILDTGGLGKKIAEEITRRWHIPIEAADKLRKFEHIELLNDAMRTSRFMAKKDSQFAQDCMLLEWDKEAMEINKDGGKRKIKDTYHSDICDAVLYGFFYVYHWTYQAEPIKPKIGTEEWRKEETDRMFNEALEYHKDQVVTNDLEWL